MTRFLASIILFAACVNTAHAEGIGEAKPRVSGFPEGFASDITGIQIGTNNEDGFLALQENRPNIDDLEHQGELGNFNEPTRIGWLYTSEDRGISLRSRDGFDFSEKFTLSVSGALTAEFPTRNFSYRREPRGDYLSYTLSSPFTGSTIEAIYRSTILDEPVQYEVLYDGIISKYGPPSFEEILNNDRLIMYYAFSNGEIVSPDSNNRFAKECSNFLLFPRPISQKDGRLFFQGNNYFEPGRAAKAADIINGDMSNVCEASIQVTLLQGGDRRTVSRISTYMVDHLAMLQDLSAITNELNQRYDDYLAQPVGATEAPEL